MLYGTMSQGYEPGGFNVSEDVADELVGFDSEEAVSYEAGWKGRLMDGRMTASVAAFYRGLRPAADRDSDSDRGRRACGIDQQRRGLRSSTAWKWI